MGNRFTLQFIAKFTHNLNLAFFNYALIIFKLNFPIQLNTQHNKKPQKQKTVIRKRLGQSII